MLQFGQKKKFHFLTLKLMLQFKQKKKKIPFFDPENQAKNLPQ